MFTSKELYIMNGGNKMYIGKDGFADVYDATPAEEAQWAEEVIKAALRKIDTEENAAALESAVENLLFHKYPDLATLLLQKLEETSTTRQLVFASSLWNLVIYETRFQIIFKILLQCKAKCVNDLFLGTRDFKNHAAAKHFLVYCLEEGDDMLVVNAQRVLSIWAGSGMPALRKDRILDLLQPEFRNLPAYKTAVHDLKEILQIKK